jgi:hypothetical protein
LRKIEQAIIGTYDGFTFYFVDGDAVRDIDIDFVSGGNPARYLYVPEGHLWIERNSSNKDTIDTMLHEYKECKKMIEDGWAYERSHGYALDIGIKIRKDKDLHGDIFEKFKELAEKY